MLFSLKITPDLKFQDFSKEGRSSRIYNHKKSGFCTLNPVIVFYFYIDISTNILTFNLECPCFGLSARLFIIVRSSRALLSLEDFPLDSKMSHKCRFYLHAVRGNR